MLIQFWFKYLFVRRHSSYFSSYPFLLWLFFHYESQSVFNRKAGAYAKSKNNVHRKRGH